MTTNTQPLAQVEQPKMPSADLINYRFDMIDNKLLETGIKLDKLTLSFATKEEAHAVKEDLLTQIAALQGQISAERADRRWRNRMISSAAVGALLVSLGTLIVWLLAGARKP